MGKSGRSLICGTAPTFYWRVRVEPRITPDRIAHILTRRRWFSVIRYIGTCEPHSWTGRPTVARRTTPAHKSRCLAVDWWTSWLALPACFLAELQSIRSKSVTSIDLYAKLSVYKTYITLSVLNCELNGRAAGGTGRILLKTERSLTEGSVTTLKK